MTVSYISDIHADFYVKPEKGEQALIKFLDKFNIKNIEKSDVLIIAGDISHYVSQIKTILEYFSTKFKHVIFCTGNHEFYNVSTRQNLEYPDLYTKFNHIKEVANSIHNVHMLDGSYIDINGIIFAGGMSWHDSKFLEKYFPEDVLLYESYWSRTMNDSRLIPKLIEPNILTYSEHEKLRSLQDKLERIDVLVTHYIPSINKDMINESYRNDAITTFYTFDGINILGKLWDTIKVSVHGHTHNSFKKKIDGKLFLRNPLGYPMEKRKMIIENFKI